MVFLNYTTMQMTAKIVYYGPGLCGKTTNLQWIHSRTAPRSRGDMVSLETETDRTLFFDLLPLDVGIIGGMKVRLQLYTVPGQVFYNATRRLVLKGVDGVVFVADSQAPAMEPNEESLANLKQNLEELGLGISTLPIVFQYNKRDLRNILPVDRLEAALNPGGAPSFEAAAIHGVGVFETLKEISRLALDSVRHRIAAEQRAPGGDSPVSAEGAQMSPSASPPPSPPVSEPPPTPDPVDDAASPGGTRVNVPVEVEFAEEDTDKVKVRPVLTKDSLDIGAELEKLREITRDHKARVPTAVRDSRGGDTPPDVAAPDPDSRQEVHRRATLEVPSHLLKGLTDLRVHLGFDRDGREEIVRDAVRLTVVGTRRLEKLSVRLEMDLKSKD
jgi:signal recognition particle receptor subunit beta